MDFSSIYSFQNELYHTTNRKAAWLQLDSIWVDLCYNTIPLHSITTRQTQNQSKNCAIATPPTTKIGAPTTAPEAAWTIVVVAAAGLVDDEVDEREDDLEVVDDEEEVNVSWLAELGADTLAVDEDASVSWEPGLGAEVPGWVVGVVVMRELELELELEVRITTAALLDLEDWMMMALLLLLLEEIIREVVDVVPVMTSLMV